MPSRLLLVPTSRTISQRLIRGALVLPQLGPRAEHQHDEIEAAVAVEIGDAASAVHGDGAGETGLGGRIAESSRAAR